MINSYDYRIKISFFGSQNVGKTSLINTFQQNSFTNVTPTFITDCQLMRLRQVNNIKDGLDIIVHLWDTSEQLQQMFTAYYCRKSNGIAFIYDITNRKSFENVMSLLTDFDRKTYTHAVKILIGNKKDIQIDREVGYNEGRDFANSIGVLFFETSAKEFQNINESINELISQIIKTKFYQYIFQVDTYK